MGEGSPLFSSAMELLAHAIEHYAGGTERDRRLMILHLANAAELLLKDACLDLGESVYEEKRSATKGVWEIIRDLERHGTAIPQKPILELLIEERNNIQHRFGSESEVMANWYMEKMLEFFSDFVSARFTLGLRDYLADFIDASVLHKVSPDLGGADPFVALKQSARQQPVGAVLTAWIEIEKQMEELRARLRATDDDQPRRYAREPTSILLQRIARFMEAEEGEKLFEEYRSLQTTRARVLHGREVLDEPEAIEAIDRMAALLRLLQGVSGEISVGEAAESESSPQPPDE